MIALLQPLDISFRELELVVFRKMQEMFVKTMEDVLKDLDEVVLGTRDTERYHVKDIRTGCVPTLVGDVRFTRRYYLDKETGEYTFLLDRILDIEAGRVSPGLALAAAMQAVICPSYRTARESLKRLYGHQVLSHETIRQLILGLGELVAKEEAQKREEPMGTREVPVLFVEADGYWCSMQRDKQKSREIRMVVSHEGWKKRSPGSAEHELVHKSHFLDLDSEDFWDEASRHLYSRYKIDDKVMVVINGDRASWIRQGVEYFPKAIYQVDRFHLKRDLRELLRGTRGLGACLRAVDASDIETLVNLLSQAKDRAKRSISGLAKFNQINSLIESILRMPEAFQDYRVRLKQMGYDTVGMRGMGAAESNVDSFSNRLKKRGQSWGLEGLKAMVHSLVKYFEGKLEHYSKHVGRVHRLLDDSNLTEEASKVARGVVRKVAGVKMGNLPAIQSGTTGSGGLSRLLRKITNQGLVAT